MNNLLNIYQFPQDPTVYVVFEITDRNLSFGLSSQTQFVKYDDANQLEIIGTYENRNEAELERMKNPSRFVMASKFHRLPPKVFEPFNPQNPLIYDVPKSVPEQPIVFTFGQEPFTFDERVKPSTFNHFQ